LRFPLVGRLVESAADTHDDRIAWFRAGSQAAARHP
jgi:hypothetical protein